MTDVFGLAPVVRGSKERMSTFSDLLSRRNFWQPRSLGPLETQVLDVLWRQGQCSVREVLGHIERPLAYTTVMTTLDRMFKKGLLTRTMADRSFRYAPCDARYVRDGSGDRNAVFSQSAREMLVSHLLDTVCEYDKTLLDELERHIAERRRQHESQAAAIAEVQE